MTVSARRTASRAASSTSSGSAARGSRRTRTSRAGGARRCAAGTRARRSSWRRSTGVEMDVGGEPAPPDGFEVVVSTRPQRARRRSAARRAPRRARGASPVDRRRRRAREDDDRRDDRVRPARARTGPRVDHRRRRPAARRQRGNRRRAGSSSRATSPTARSRSSAPRSRSLTNVELDHHATFASEAELQAFFDEWTARRAEASSAAGSSSPSPSSSRSPESTTAGMRPRRSRRSSSRVSPREDASARARRLHRRRPPLPARRRPRRRLGLRRLRAQPDGDRGGPPDGARARGARSDRRLPAARPRADEASPSRARRRPRDCGRGDRDRRSSASATRRSRASAGKLVLDDVPRGVRRGWAPTLDDAAALALAWARPGDVVVTLGVGEPWKVARAIAEGLPGVKIEHGVPALPPDDDRDRRAGARPSRGPRPSPTSSTRCATRGTRVSRSSSSASGRTCSRPTKAWTRSCCGSKASSRRPRSRRSSAAGGGATNAVCLHRARGCRPRRLRVRVRDPRHRGRGREDERGRVRARLVGRPRSRARRDGGRHRVAVAPPSSASRTATPSSAPGQVVARVEYRLDAAPAGGDQGDRRRARRAPQGDPADEQAHLRKRLQEPAGRARRRPDARALRPEGTPDRRCERSRRSTRTSSRTRAARRAPTASRSWSRRAGARASSSASCSSARWSSPAASSCRRSSVGAPGPAANVRRMAGGRTERGSRRRTRAASVVVPFPRAPSAIAWISLGSSPPAALSSSASPSSRRVLVAYWGARSTAVFAVERVEVQGAPPAVVREVREATPGRGRTSLLDGRRASDRGHGPRAPVRRRRLRRSRVPAHARRQGRAGAARSPSFGAASGAWLATGAGRGRPGDRDRHATAASRGCG